MLCGCIRNGGRAPHIPKLGMELEVSTQLDAPHALLPYGKDFGKV